MGNIKWDKKGLLFTPDTEKWWMKTHTAAPTVINLKDNKFRIFFCGRDIKNRSQIGFFDVTVNNEVLHIDNVCEEPILENGKLGCFDDNGVTPSCAVKYEDKIYLYYIGWNPGSTTRMNIFGGLATANSFESKFERYSMAPIIERSKINPYINTSPFVLYDKVWRMYYVAGIEWVHKDLPRYNIQYCESNNGLDWCREGKVSIDFENENEVALARPWVIKDNDLYRMWYCKKSLDTEYELGYAESFDGITWNRKDDLAGVDAGSLGWDSEMVAYPSVFKFGDKYFMLYNGNGYGMSGIGYAVGIESPLL